MTPPPVAPGGVVGVLGGGQLGRMLAIAAARLGLRVWIHAEAADAPAADVAWRATVGGADFSRGLEAFADGCDVVTFESENTPAAAIDAIGPRAIVAPGRSALETAQDRFAEKTFLRAVGLSTAGFERIDGPGDIDAALVRLGGSGVLKTRRFGYDGKGQVWLRTEDGPDAAASAWAAIGGAPAILEQRVRFRREISAIVARDRGGRTAVYDPAVNVHEAGVLRTSRVDGAVGPATAAAAADAAARLAAALDYVGVMGVEFFETADSALLVNEFAPRVHNSGHWTLEACAVDQFEQHVRAICGWPLGAPDRHSDVEMRNLLGDEVDDWAGLATQPGQRLHLYGKSDARPGRKMGHATTILGPATRATDL